MGEQVFGRRYGQQRGDGVCAGTLAEDRHVARLSAERRDVVADPAQSHHQVAQVEVVVDGDVLRRQRRQVEAAERPEAVVDRDVHAAAAREGGAVVDRRRRTAHEIAATVDEDHDGQAVHRAGDSGATTLRVRQSSLIGWYLPGARMVYMRCCGAQLPNPWQYLTPRHGCTGCGARISQRPDRRAGVRNRAPAVNSVAGESLDGARGDGCADGVFVHHPTVANEHSPPRLAGDRVSAR